MQRSAHKKRYGRSTATGGTDRRLQVFRIACVLFASVVMLRLCDIMLLNHATYEALAEGQHSLFRKLFPTRGSVLIHDLKDGTVIPLATNQPLYQVFADPRHVKQPIDTARALAQLFGYEEEKTLALAERLSVTTDPYEPIERNVSESLLKRVQALNLPGIQSIREETRYYPEPDLGGHVIGFLGSNDDGSRSGKYGVEGYFDDILAGKQGFLASERDISGRLISIADNDITPAVNGADVVLTIDRTIQYVACSALKRTVLIHEATGGSVIIMEPSTGRILAMCGTPDFDPNQYGAVPSVSVFNNPAIFQAWEPGSVFKPFTIAAAIDAGAITPNSLYNDEGVVHIDKFDIRNSDEQAHGIRTMTQVLEQSLNTGTIFAMRAVGRDLFAEYVRRFGFGELTGVELETESAGDIRSLNLNSEVYPATASFGQGITTTPLQIVTAMSAIANGGILKKPRIVDEIRYEDGHADVRATEDIRRVIESKTARLVGAMLVSVVENGHGKKAGVPGYYVAGKTGTAQVANPEGPGYLEGVTIGSFAGFAPAEDPKFAMIVRVDRPTDAKYAETTAAPLFGEIAAFLLQYLEVPPTRNIK